MRARAEFRFNLLQRREIKNLLELGTGVGQREGNEITKRTAAAC
jgi:hypothetical protein